MQENYICVADLQCPFEHPKALNFIKYLKKHYKVPDENMLCAGDEADNFWGGLYKKGGDFGHTPNQELQACVDSLKEWYAAFPLMKIATSNHGTRWQRKAFESEIPSQLLRSYRDMLQAPEGWKWAKQWLIKCERPFAMVHGDDYGGQTPHLQAAIHMATSVVMGHHHSIAGIEFINTKGLETAGINVWGACAGSLIDFEAYAFNYAKNAKRKPCIGTIVICNSGRFPQWIPLE